MKIIHLIQALQETDQVVEEVIELSLSDLIFGPASVIEHIAFIFFCLWGMLLIKLASYQRKKKALLRLDPPVITKFNFGIWIDDNALDFVLAFMTAFAMFRFFPDMLGFFTEKYNLPEFTDKMMYGFLLGLGFQIIFHFWMNNVTVSKTVQKLKN